MANLVRLRLNHRRVPSNMAASVYLSAARLLLYTHAHLSAFFPAVYRHTCLKTERGRASSIWRGRRGGWTSASRQTFSDKKTISSSSSKTSLYCYSIFSLTILIRCAFPLKPLHRSLILSEISLGPLIHLRVVVVEPRLLFRAEKRYIRELLTHWCHCDMLEAQIRLVAELMRRLLFRHHEHV
jgi:hypothetical protein